MSPMKTRSVDLPEETQVEEVRSAQQAIDREETSLGGRLGSSESDYILIKQDLISQNTRLQSMEAEVRSTNFLIQEVLGRLAHLGVEDSSLGLPEDSVPASLKLKKAPELDAGAVGEGSQTEPRMPNPVRRGQEGHLVPGREGQAQVLSGDGRGQVVGGEGEATAGELCALYKSLPWEAIPTFLPEKTVPAVWGKSTRTMLQSWGVSDEHIDTLTSTIAIRYLKRQAAQWWQNELARGAIPPGLTWSGLIEKLTSKFGYLHSEMAARAELEGVKQGPRSVDDYVMELEACFMKVPGITQGEQLARFKQGLHPVLGADLSMYLAEYPVDARGETTLTWAQAVIRVQMKERVLLREGQLKYEDDSGDASKKAKVMCYTCHQEGHISPNCPLNKKKDVPAPARTVSIARNVAPGRSPTPPAPIKRVNFVPRPAK
jgi:hypothetical protein